MNTERKKVLFLPSWYPNRTAPSLGNFIQRHAEAVSEFHDIAVLYVTADPSLVHDNYEADIRSENGLLEVTVYYKQVRSALPVISQLLKYRRFITAYRKGYNIIAQQFGKPDLLHINVIWRAAIFALELHKLRKIPLVISEHWSGYLPEDGSYKRGMQKKITEEAVKKAGAVTAVSERMKQSMLAHGLKNEYRIIPNVVDTGLFRPSPQPPGGKIRMIHVSTVNDREKNISGMLRAVKELSRQRQDFVLEIIGDSQERPGFEKTAETLGILDKFVIFSGYKSIEQVAESMRNSHFFLMFSNYEGLPCVILEALASGLPVVAAEVGGIPSVINAERGILVKAKDEGMLLHAMNRMADTWSSYNRENLRQYAVEHFSYHHVGRQIAEVYDKVLQGQPGDSAVQQEKQEQH